MAVPARLTDGPESACVGGSRQFGGMEVAVRMLLEGVGEDVAREGLRDTPKRVAKALLDASKGYHQTATGVLGSAYFHEPIVRDGGEGLVLVRDIDFASTSEETLLPFHGRCHIGYVPRNGVVLGLSKLARLTRMFSKRLQSQERLGLEVATALQRQLQCQGVAVVMQASHLTMDSAQPSQLITTACISGCFTEAASSAFQEVLCMAGIEAVPPGSLVQLPGTCHGQKGVTRSISGLSNSSSSGTTYAACNGVHCAPQPPPTPDLSEHLSESESNSVHSVQGGQCTGRENNKRQLSEHGSEKDLSDLASGGSDGDLSVDDIGFDMQQLVLSTTKQHHHHHLTAQCLGQHQSQPAAGDEQTTQHTLIAAGLQDAPGPSHGEAEHCCGSSSPATPTAACNTLHLPSLPSSHLAAHDPRRAKSADAMEQAVQSLISAMGECPHRSGLMGTARRYVMTLLSATSGYTRQLPAPLHARRRPNHATMWHVSGCPHGSSTGPAAGGCPCCHASQQQAAVAAAADCSSHPSAPPLLHTTAAAGVGCRHVKIAFTSQCEHHMLPFYGHVHVVYGPSVAGDQLSDGSMASVGASALPTAAEEQEAIQQIVRLYTQRLQVQERITHQVANGVVQVLGVDAVLVLVDAAHMCMVARGVENHAGHTTSVALRGGAADDAAWRARALQTCRTAGIA